MKTAMYKLTARMTVVMALIGATSAHAAGVFYNNISTPQFGGSAPAGDELADDVPFTGSQTVTKFTILYHADTTVNATFKFSGVNQTTGGVGAAVATFTATNLAAGDHVFTMDLAPAQQFVWTAAPKLRNLPQLSGGYFSARFTSATGAGSGGARWFLGINDSLDGYFDVTQGTLISGNNVDIPISLFLQIYSLEAPATPPTIFDLRVNPMPFTAGATLHGVVTLNRAAPAGGSLVDLTGDSVGVPDTVTVAAGQTTAEFDVITAPVDTTTSALVEATFNGAFRSVQLILQPAQQPPPADAVAIQRAEYRASRHELRVEATSSNASATLGVFVTSSNQLIGTLGNNGGGRFSSTLTFPVNPVNITVRSNSGGSASSAVTAR